MPGTAQHSSAAMLRVRGDGLSLAYREWPHDDPRDPIILLHGITGSSADWLATVPHLSSRRIIALDARGHGQSDWDPAEAYAGDQHFADLAVALDTLAIERCILVGFSMGGGVAMLGAAALPDRVSSAVIIDTYPDPAMSPGSRRIAEWIAGYASGSPWFDPAISRHFAEQLAAGHEDRLDLWSMWDAISCPTLLVRGALSDVLTTEAAAEMVRRQPNARLCNVPGVAHGVPYLRPAELGDAIEAFLTSIGPRS